MNEIILNDIKPVNLNINLNKFCKECNVFRPEIDKSDYTLTDYNVDYLRVETYNLTCQHMNACLKYNI